MIVLTIESPETVCGSQAPTSALITSVSGHYVDSDLMTARIHPSARIVGDVCVQAVPLGSGRVWLHAISGREPPEPRIQVAGPEISEPSLAIRLLPGETKGTGYTSR